MGGLEAVDPRYRTLYEDALAVLGGDGRVAGVEVVGSVGAGTADAWSDLDLCVVTHDDGYASFLDEWPAWLAAITPTVFARTPIAPFVINTVTAEGLTFDVSVYATARPNFDAPPAYAVGMLSSRRFTEVGPALEYAVAEQLRGLAGPFISLVQRDEHVRHLAGISHLLGLLTTVFLAETAAPPAGKHWNESFTVEQRAAVAALPPARATRDDIVAFGLALAEMVITRARPLFPHYDLVWPTEFAAVVAARIDECLDIDVRAWLA